MCHADQIFMTTLDCLVSHWKKMAIVEKLFWQLGTHFCSCHHCCRQGQIQGEGAGGAHPPPRWLQFSNTTGILQKKLCGLLVLKYSKRRVHPLLKKILDPPLVERWFMGCLPGQKSGCCREVVVEDRWLWVEIQLYHIKVLPQRFYLNGKTILDCIHRMTKCLSITWSKSVYNGLYGESVPERSTLFRLQVYERVGISLVEVHKRLV